MAADKASTVAVEVQRVAGATWLPTDESFERWVKAAFNAAELPDNPPAEAGEMTVRLVGLEEGTALNTEWRHKAGPTNVLAFPGPTPHTGVAGQPVEYGDLVICLPVVEQEATDQHKERIDHLAHLVVHGTLHLLGYTHEAEPDAARMEALETRVLAGLDIADPYASNGAPH
ncbi:MAG: rRNA maturation RNase YbeY [Gammaproteobacteria bacterium PRO9]|nr:rRNA maturation RNase YbeY [Gammaproteobacteria bacterium PRO9]